MSLKSCAYEFFSKITHTHTHTHTSCQCYFTCFCTWKVCLQTYWSIRIKVITSCTHSMEWQCLWVLRTTVSTQVKCLPPPPGQDNEWWPPWKLSLHSRQGSIVTAPHLVPALLRHHLLEAKIRTQAQTLEIEIGEVMCCMGGAPRNLPTKSAALCMWSNSPKLLAIKKARVLCWGTETSSKLQLTDPS